MALALALEQAEQQRDGNPATDQPLGTEGWTALQPSAARDTAQHYNDAGSRCYFGTPLQSFSVHQNGACCSQSTCGQRLQSLHLG